MANAAPASVPVVPLVGFCLSPGTATLRDHVLAADRQAPDYLAKYDRTTLFYDCVHDAARGRMLITAPRLLNLWPVLRDGLTISGQPVRGLRRRVFPKYEQITLRMPFAPLGLTVDGETHRIVPRRSNASDFAGRNAVVTMSHNNPLDWIVDWLRFHVRAHGLDSVAFVDNRSDAYSPEDIADAIRGVDGIAAAAVFTAPYPYGPVIGGKGVKIKPNFLQSAILNMARSDVLSRARAVLNADIDEIVLGQTGANIFDATAKTWHGAINIGGDFAFPAAAQHDVAPLAAHRFRADPPRRSTRKWCVRPGSLLSNLGWFVHQVGGEAFRLVPESRVFKLVHCAATNPNWARLPKALRPEALTPDRDLEAMLERYLND